MDYYTFSKYGLQVRELDIRHTVESAQPLTFYADYDLGKGLLSYVGGNGQVNANFTGTSKNCAVRFDSRGLSAARKDFVERFRLKDDMADIYENIATDDFMRSAIKNYRGMRITLNDPWETTLCFIVSQYNNVKRIRLIIKRFVKEFGSDVVDSNGKVVGKSFPTSERLTEFSEADFRRCGAGFRAKYIAKAAECCTNNIDLYKLRKNDYDGLKENLMTISGVGDKVADCIALMGYGKMEAFPIDVWVKRTLEKVYFKGKDKKIGYLHKFAEDRFGAYSGQAQQYIFWQGRNL
ncbi:MAG: DNA-3-methyladenine glycosylase 2 [Candidatus Micrarchaeaceae archaeon]|jgi:N-glycosylase/DNA lyase